MNVDGTQHEIGDSPIAIHAEANTKRAAASLLKQGDGAFICHPKRIDAVRVAPYHTTLKHDGEEQIILQSITALPSHLKSFAQKIIWWATKG